LRQQNWTCDPGKSRGWGTGGCPTTVTLAPEKHCQPHAWRPGKTSLSDGAGEFLVLDVQLLKFLVQLCCDDWYLGVTFHIFLYRAFALPYATPSKTAPLSGPESNSSMANANPGISTGLSRPSSYNSVHSNVLGDGLYTQEKVKHLEEYLQLQVSFNGAFGAMADVMSSITLTLF